MEWLDRLIEDAERRGEPHPDLGLTPEDGLGVWCVLVSWRHDHSLVTTEGLCMSCSHPTPCQGRASAESSLTTLVRSRAPHLLTDDESSPTPPTGFYSP